MPSGKDSEGWLNSYFYCIVEIRETSDSGLFLGQRSIYEGEKEQRVAWVADAVREGSVLKRGR